MIETGFHISNESGSKITVTLIFITMFILMFGYLSVNPTKTELIFMKFGIQSRHDLGDRIIFIAWECDRSRWQELAPYKADTTSF